MGETKTNQRRMLTTRRVDIQNPQEVINRNSSYKKEAPKLCFICHGPHWTRDCPNRKAINAIVAEYNNEKADEPQADLGAI